MKLQSNLKYNWSDKKELLERKIGDDKSKIDLSLKTCSQSIDLFLSKL